VEPDILIGLFTPGAFRRPFILPFHVRLRRETRLSQRFHHEAPAWVKAGSAFHIRLRATHGSPRPLTDPDLATQLLSGAANYHQRGRWHCHLFLLMPDHIHSLVTSPRELSMSTVRGGWKRYTPKALGVYWQVNFFAHRIRRNQEFAETWACILANPVVKNPGAYEHSWPWR
jgi:REP element-mobilizing transposase RayT